MILSHQKHAFEGLMKLGQTAFGADWNSLPMRLRTNTLIVGPSGSGKSFLAQRVAEVPRRPVGPVVPTVAPKPDDDKTVSDYLAPLIEEDDGDGEF